jgi:hypothetical protein
MYICSACLFYEESSQASEVYKPLQDPLISRCVDIIGMNEDKASVSEKLAFAAKGVLSKVFPKPRRAWLPTGCLVCLSLCLSKNSSFARLDLYECSGT